jgi:hypothetical protein
MNLKPIHYFLGGVALTALIAAAKFVGGTPLDQTFTYQGQLRNAGQLVNGPVDLKISMWDADTGGSQVGSTNTFNAMQLNDGRFACGLNFGNAAFDGSNRWIQVEFRNPAGSGQYQALSPRDKITATPYALYALNGANGVWVYDTNQQSVSVMGKKVGIGTSNPTAALEVVSDITGDDAVKLPEGSINATEVSADAVPSGFQWIDGFTNNSAAQSILAKTIVVPVDGELLICFYAQLEFSNCASISLQLDGTTIASSNDWPLKFDSNWQAGTVLSGNRLAHVAAGPHTLRFVFNGSSCWSAGSLMRGRCEMSGAVVRRAIP